MSAGRQAAAVERQDLVVEPLEPPLPLPHDLRLERPRPIARRLDPHLAVLGDQRLRASTRSGCYPPHRAAPGAARSRGGRSARPPAPAPPAAWSAARATHPGPGDLLLRPSAREQLVDHLVRQKRLQLLSELRPPSRRPPPAPRFARPPGSLRSAPAAEGSVDSSNLLGIVVDMDLLSIHAYTDRRTLPLHHLNAYQKPCISRAFREWAVLGSNQ